MSLSTRPALRVASPENALAVVVPSRIRHSADEDLVLDAEWDDRKRPLRRPMDVSSSEVTNTAPRMHVRREKQWVVLGAVAYTKDRILIIHGISGRRHEVIAVGSCVCDHVPPGRATEMGAPVEERHDADLLIRVVVIERETARRGEVVATTNSGVSFFNRMTRTG